MAAAEERASLAIVRVVVMGWMGDGAWSELQRLGGRILKAVWAGFVAPSACASLFSWRVRLLLEIKIEKDSVTCSSSYEYSKK